MPSPHSTAARERLIAIAGPIFARLGYPDATVKLMCEAAGVNVAAINYHFGDKYSLYKAVMEQAIEWLKKGRKEHRMPTQNVAEIPHVLHQPLLRILKGMFSGEENLWPLTLILRELMQPSSEFALLIREQFNAITPSTPLIRSISALTGLSGDDPRLQWALFCFLSPALLLAAKPEAMARQFPALDVSKLDMEAFARFCAQLSLHGLSKVSPSARRRD